MIDIGRWAVGLDRKTNDTIMRLEFTDRPPLELRAPAGEAQAIASAILQQYANPPPKSLS